jgi:hypothetical protein
MHIHCMYMYIQCIYMYIHCTWVPHIVCIHYCVCYCMLGCTAFAIGIYHTIVEESTSTYRDIPPIYPLRMAVKTTG